MSRKPVITFDRLVEMGEKPDFTRLRWRVLYVLKVQYGDNKSRMTDDLGCSTGTIGNWLTRDDGMDHTYAYYLMDKYRWDARWILDGTGEPKLPDPLTPAERKLLDDYRQADERRQEAAKFILENQAP